MQLAWRQGFHNLQLESGSKTLVDMITRKVKINGKPTHLDAPNTTPFKVELACAFPSYLTRGKYK